MTQAGTTQDRSVARPHVAPAAPAPYICAGRGKLTPSLATERVDEEGRSFAEACGLRITKMIRNPHGEPEVAAIMPRMQRGTQRTALVTLRHVDEALDPAAQSANLPARLHDLGVVARALLTLYVQCREPRPGEEPSDVDGWLLTSAPPYS